MLNLIRLILYQPLYNLLIFFAWIIPSHSVGWAIILLTLLVRLILYPSFKKTIAHQKKMLLLKPHLDRIRQDHKDDRKTLAEKTMALYKEHGISPFSSFGPLLIQLPILIVLYYVLINGIKEIQLDLLYSFTPRPESLNPHFFGLDLTKPDRIFLPLLAGVLQFFQGKQLMNFQSKLQAKDDKGADFQMMLQKQMTYFFPLITIFVAVSLPAALALYWAATTGFGILQQWWVTRESSAEGSPSGNAPIPMSKVAEKEETTGGMPEKTKSGVELTIRKKSER